MTTPGGPGATPTRRTRVVRWRVNAAGAVVLVVLGIVWVVAYGTTRGMDARAAWVAHTQEVRVAIRGTAAALREAEAAHRDYLLTGDERDGVRYARAKEEHHGRRRQVRRLTGGDREQQARLDSLDRLVASRLALLDTLARALETEGPEPAQARMAHPSSQRHAAEIATLLRTLEHEEDRRLAVRLDASRAQARRAALMVLSTGGIALLIVAGAAVLVNRDITRQGRDARALRHALRAAGAANEAKSRFLATVSHEIRTPLNAIGGMTELLLETRLDSEQAEFARIVHSNSESLAVLIGDLLDSSKIEAGQVDLDPVPFDLRELVEGVADVLAVRAEAKGVDLVADVAPDAATHLLGDRDRLRQVLMNLVGNAIKFTERGDVVVRARTADAADGRVAVSIAVRDTGIGISPEAQERIFEPFAQADRSTVRRFGGTGLGLTISRSLVELMGGTLSLESEPGRGSTFRVDLPLPRAPEGGARNVAPEALAGVRVTVVEPNGARREMIRALLAGAGARVGAWETPAGALAAADGDAAVAVVGEDADASSGLDTARRLRAGGAVPPSVVLVCSLRSVMTEHVGRDGIAEVVYKPVKQRRLVEAVARAAGRRLPAPAEAAETDVRPARPAVPFRVLLVEDHRDNWLLLTRHLASAGYAVDVAESGPEGVDRANAFRYDLVFMDVELPGIDGIEATRRIRAGERALGREPVPIVALTAHALESVRTAALGAGVDDYATKPISKAHLLDLCERWIDRRPVILVADDSPENHVLVDSYLHGAGYRHLDVHDGRQAVEAFARQRVSLVLLDMDMPVMDGYEAARALRRMPGGGTVPIVALTGYQGAEERERSLRAGCTAHLGKPVRRSELLATVASLVGPLPDAHPPAFDTLPAPRAAAGRVEALLARREFGPVTALAEEVGRVAGSMEMHRLAAVCTELAEAARQEDAERAAWWAEQLASALREAERLREVRDAARAAPASAGPYDALARVAAALLRVPMAAVTMVDEERLRIEGAEGLSERILATREMPVEDSFCRHVALTGAPLVIEDARQDALVSGLPGVVEDQQVAYAGVPLTVAGGITLGSVCAIDHHPRRWTAADVAALRDLADVVLRQMELERRAAAAPAPAATDAPVAAPPPAPVASAVPTTTAAPAPAAEGERRAEVSIDLDVARLIPRYVQARRRDVVEVRRLLREGSLREVQRLGHNMKGSGEAYGLPDVTRHGRELEHAAEHGDTAGAERAISLLEAYLDRVHAPPAGAPATDPSHDS